MGPNLLEGDHQSKKNFESNVQCFLDRKETQDSNANVRVTRSWYTYQGMWYIHNVTGPPEALLFDVKPEIALK